MVSLFPNLISDLSLSQVTFSASSFALSGLALNQMGWDKVGGGKKRGNNHCLFSYGLPSSVAQVPSWPVEWDWEECSFSERGQLLFLLAFNL